MKRFGKNKCLAKRYCTINTYVMIGPFREAVKPGVT